MRMPPERPMSLLNEAREFLQSVEQEDKANKISGKEAH